MSIDPDISRYFADPPVFFRRTGDEDVADGPIEQDGWYVDPYCHPMCCRPDGPFPTRRAACEWAWREYEVAEQARIPPERSYWRRHHKA